MTDVNLTITGTDTVAIDQWDIINGLIDSLDGALKILAVKRMTEAEEQQVCGYIEQIDTLRGDTSD